MNRIIKLDRETANKIAAGEVVERPLSVVKELIENAIDANSTSITVEIVNGGKSLIRVTDNGDGINKDDILIAFERHATSKIRKAEDIYKTNSLGFRGEALASIGSVSNIVLVTRNSEDKIGTKLTLSANKVVDKTNVGFNRGTTISVMDLFFNTPAREKFMKSSSSETAAISDIVNKLALSNKNIDFKYIVDKKNMFITKKENSLIESIFSIYSREISKNMIEIYSDTNSLKISGYISNVKLTKANRKMQIVFVNGRYIKSKEISEALRISYKTMIPSGRHPLCFIFIEINPSEIDVNIHPSKTEIKFNDDGLIKQEIYKTVRKALLENDLIPEIELKTDKIQFEDRNITNKKNNINLESEIKTAQKHQLNNYKSNINENVVDVKKNKATENKNNSEFKENISFTNSISKNTSTHKPFSYNNSALSKEVNPSKVISLDDFVIEDNYSKDYTHEKKIISNTSELYDNLVFIGSIFSTYLIFEKNSKMYMIDQHAAHEKVLYEEYLLQFKNKKLNSQILLDPIIIALNYIDYSKAINNIESFKNLGVYIESFGENSIIIRELPIAFNSPVTKDFVLEILSKIDKNFSNVYDLKTASIIQSSCKNAIKANDLIMDIEVDSLLSRLKKLDDPYTCPHGRPIIIAITKNEIMKKFKRI